jgi:hypothetical protein
MHRLLMLGLATCGRIAFDPLPGDGVVNPDALPAGLVAWFELEEQAGAPFIDSAAARNGSCEGTCPQLTAGHIGSAQLFDGVADCITVADLGHLQLATFTLAMWMRLDAAVRVSPLSKQFSTGTDNSWQLENSAASLLALRFTTRNAVVDNTISPANTIVVGRWHHVAGTWDGAAKRVYIDGVEQASTTIGSPIMYDANAMLIGCDNNSGVFIAHHQGALDDIQIYDRALGRDDLVSLAAR